MEWGFFCGFCNFSLCLLSKHNIEILSRLVDGDGDGVGGDAIDEMLLPTHANAHTNTSPNGYNGEIPSAGFVRWHVCKINKQTSFHRVIFN